MSANPTPLLSARDLSVRFGGVLAVVLGLGAGRDGGDGGMLDGGGY